MASRYATHSNNRQTRHAELCGYRLHQRPARNALFANYDNSTSRSRPASAGPATPAQPTSRNAPYNTKHSNNSSPYSFTSQPNGSATHLSPQPSNTAFGAYPNNGNDAAGQGSGDGGFRSATPDKKGRYADAVYNELESQNDEQVSVMTEKVKMLKSVCADPKPCMEDRVRADGASIDYRSDRRRDSGLHCFRREDERRL